MSHITENPPSYVHARMSQRWRSLITFVLRNQQQSQCAQFFHTYFRVYDGNTCSGLSPGGTQAYSSKAQPESSSEVEFLWKSYISLVTVFSISTGMAVTACSSRRHLQCTQIFLQRAQDNENLSRRCYFCVKTIKGIRASLKK